MESDARIVRARIEILSAQLHAMKSRRSHVGAPAEEQAALDAVAGFFDAVSREGWMPPFDAAIAALKTWATRTTGEERIEVGSLLDHLAEVESSVLRLAAEAQRKPPENAETSPFLRPSTYSPSVHAYQASRAPVTIKRIVEPGERRQLERTVRDALEELASLSLLRATAVDEAWALGVGFERRLFECLDALAAYRRGAISVDVDAVALDIAKRYPVVDASRWFAAAFIVACTKGDRCRSSLAPEASCSMCLPVDSRGSSTHLHSDRAPRSTRSAFLYSAKTIGRTSSHWRSKRAFGVRWSIHLR